MVWLILLLFSGTAVAETDVEVEVLKEGSCRGREEARSGAKVTLDYEGFLEDRRTRKNGKKFTSTYGLSDPYTFNIGQDEVIPGLEQVTILMFSVSYQINCFELFWVFLLSGMDLNCALNKICRIAK